ncbi:MAG: PilZ domain-containing protein [Chthonomonadetes bacterium]|nr:PilZ domain-containing protein [Chthonomonadetes bacterium]
MGAVFSESAVVHQPPAWWQRVLVADGQSWVWVGTLIISLTLIAILALRYLYYLWWLHRIRLLRGQGLLPSSELRVGQCAYLQMLSGSEEERLRRWRTMVRSVHSGVVEVDIPAGLDSKERFAPGTRVVLAVNAIDSLYVMETEVVDIAGGESGVLKLRRQLLMHRLQRRQFARVDLFVPATVDVVGGKSIGRYACTLMDIGGGGVCLQAPVAVAVGSVVRLESPAMGDVLPESTRLTVVGVSETVVDGHVEYRLHCAFTDLNTEQLERVARFVHRKQREAMAQQRWYAPQEHTLSDLRSATP